ncbi:MAG: FtsW/RodA/SpoVE family cell cycle protein [Planctomycetota bacterium]|jgi:cell division protein FtsW
MRRMLRAGHGIALCVIALLTIGVVMIQSAAMTVGGEANADVVRFLTGRTAALAALAVVCLVLGSLMPVSTLGRLRGLANPAPWLVLGILALLVIVSLPGVGREVNGARRWLDLGPVGFQPSEIAKWGLLVVLAAYGARRAEVVGRFWRGFLPPVSLIALVAALIAVQDLGTAVLIGVVGVAVLVAAGARLWHALLLAPAATAGFVVMVLSNPYRLDRLRAFLDPYADSQGIGYHVIQSMAAVSGGGLAGRGLGNSIQKFGYLPEDTTDFIFAIICEELGIGGAIFVVFLYVALLLGCRAVVRGAGGPFERLLGLGVLLTIGLQALINMAVVTGAAPTKGIALPLVSSGGTGWALTAFSLGLLISMDREQASRAASEPVLARPAARSWLSHTSPSGTCDAPPQTLV